MSVSSSRESVSASWSASLKKNGRPMMKAHESGAMMTNAQLEDVVMRTVLCDEVGATQPLSEDGGFVKTEILSLKLNEQRVNPENGNYGSYPLQMTEKKHKIGLLTMTLNGKEFDLTTKDGKLQFIFAQSMARLPVQALLSVQYVSPLGGHWYVDAHPVDLKFGEPELKQSSCCVIS